jgi:Auxiliary Activity family 9 (formerly GH61)
MNNNTDEVQIPSDIAPGMYIFRTELLALMGNSPMIRYGPYGGPQFFVHCFNVQVTGNGKAIPKGIKFAEAYKRNDASLNFDVWGRVQEHKNYVRNLNKPSSLLSVGCTHISWKVAPGPPVYKGEYNAPTGPAPIVKETGYYPPDLQKKYVALRDKWTEFATAAIGFINSSDAGNSRKGEPTAAETAQLTTRLNNAKSQIPSFLIELEAFMEEVEKRRKSTKRWIG